MGEKNVALESGAGFKLQPSLFLVAMTFPNLSTGFSPPCCDTTDVMMFLNTEALNSLCPHGWIFTDSASSVIPLR